MKKKFEKKLILDKKVVAKLTDLDVQTVKGGAGGFSNKVCDENSPACAPPDTM